MLSVLSSVLSSAYSYPHTAPATVFNALTTIFTPRSDCVLRQTSPAWSVQWSFASIDAGTLFCTRTLRDIIPCYPPEAAVALLDSSSLTFSPAVCPDGFNNWPGTFVSQWRSLSPGPDGSTFTITRSMTETFPGNFCCPFGMIMIESIASYCISAVTTPTQIQFSGTNLKIPMSVPFMVMMPAMQAMWQSNDLLNFTPPSAPLLGPSKSSTTISIPTLDHDTLEVLRKYGALRENSRLATGAIVGIGVGVSIGALAIFVSASTLFWRRYKRKHMRDRSKPELSDESRQLPELDPERQLAELPPEYLPLETNSDCRYEMDAGYTGSKLATMAVPGFRRG